MRQCINPTCRKPIAIMIRQAESACSLDCDRALGTGKYLTERVEAMKKKSKKGKKRGYRCKRPPTGWFCKREADHEGPCPAWPRWWNLKWARYRFRWLCA